MTTRRDFLRQTALLGAGLTISPFFIKAGSAGVGANDKIGVGLIGCNGMGFEDLKAFLRNPEVECIALSDIDENVLNNRAAETEKITGKKVKHLYKDWRKLIDNKDIDLVIVGTPDHWHCLQMVSACQAGKDVYCEKPLGNSIEECNIMVRAAQKYNRVVQVGQWQRSDPHWQDAMHSYIADSWVRYAPYVYSLIKVGAPLSPSSRTRRCPPEWTMICGWGRPRNVRSIGTVFISHSVGSGIMQEV